MTEETQVVNPVIETADLSPGRAIVLAREARNMTTAEVAQHLKFGVKQIEALEADDYSKLPGNTLVRGMIRSYAKLLQIDPEPLLSAHGRRQIPAEVTVDLRSERIPFPDGVKRSTRTYGLLTIVILMGVVGIAYEWQMAPSDSAAVVFVAPSKSTNDRQPARSADASTPAMPLAALPVPTDGQVSGASPAGAPPAGQEPEVAVTSVKLVKPPKPGSLRRIDLEFDKDSWVEIKQSDGRTLLSQINRGGTRQVLEGTPPFSVVIGNAPAVHMRYNDESIDLKPHFRVDVARLTLE